VLRWRHLLLGLLLTASSGGTMAGESPAPLAAREVEATANGATVRLTFVLFSPRDFELRVVDNANSSDTARFPRLAEAMRELGGAAGCNGGFFNQKPFDPVGLMIASGVRAGTFDPLSWMKGLVVVRDGELRLEEAATFTASPAVSHALQTGPWLVRGGVAEKHADHRGALRTFICRDGNGRWAIGTSARCSLGDLPALLTSPEVASLIAIKDALNLDGGPSTGLWVNEPGQPYSLPERWPVRNYLGLFPAR
jgi:uncharacterized protein YigE (DUF2233 family)